MKLTKQRLKEIIKEELEVVLTDEEASEMFGGGLSEARPAAERGDAWDESRGPEEHPGTRRSVAVMKLEEMGEARDSALIQLLRHVPFSDEDLAVLERLIGLLVEERRRDFREPLEDEKLAALEAEAGDQELAAAYGIEGSGGGGARGKSFKIKEERR
tara:strand:- start:37 stop:510 length:474 start_codon:yes stop_codon:yes gene_type:complete